LDFDICNFNTKNIPNAAKPQLKIKIIGRWDSITNQISQKKWD